MKMLKRKGNSLEEVEWGGEEVGCNIQYRKWAGGERNSLGGGAGERKREKEGVKIGARNSPGRGRGKKNRLGEKG